MGSHVTHSARGLRGLKTNFHSYTSYGVFPRRTLALGDQLDAAPARWHRKSATAVASGRRLRSRLPSRIFERVLRSTSSWSPDLHLLQTLGGAERHAMSMLGLSCLAWLSARSHGMSSAERPSSLLTARTLLAHRTSTRAL